MTASLDAPMSTLAARTTARLVHEYELAEGGQFIRSRRSKTVRATIPATPTTIVEKTNPIPGDSSI